ncbi:ZIP family metal transporter [bacterium]|nr:ZIP family metal transporter [bacterium]|tara:strand:- start:741 stop:1499 length:759 start_codon:yes stop_codon:yes gene_type:complete
MSILLYAIIGSVAVSLISLIGIFTVKLDQAKLRYFTFLSIGLAGGAMFGNAFIHLIPEAIEILEANLAAFFVLLGILAFFILEKFLHWHHHDHFDQAEHDHSDMHHKPLGYLVLTSDVLHNFIDGIAIGAAFLISVEAGIAVTIAIALHEIPQELSDFGLLIHSGFSRGQALLTNFASSLTALLGVLVVFAIGENELLVAGTSAVAAGMFVYIAGSDLVPQLHKTSSRSGSATQLFMMVIGMTAMFALVLIE